MEDNSNNSTWVIVVVVVLMIVATILQIVFKNDSCPLVMDRTGEVISGEDCR